MSAITRYHLRRASLVLALVLLAALLGATVVLAQVDSAPGIADVPGLPGGQVTIIGALLSAILYLAKRLESRPTAETLARAYTELDAMKADNSRLRELLDAERVARLRAEFGARPAGGGAA